MLMTTDPGDLILDPTCGSGTTPFVAEQWGHSWITIDTSRVALALARQRLLTAKYDYYALRTISGDELQSHSHGTWLSDPTGNIDGKCTFDCKNVPHITLKSIAQNIALDPIFARWAPILAEKLSELNTVLRQMVTLELRKALKMKLLQKEKMEGKKAVTDADRRRWDLPESAWQEWEVPFDTDPDWPELLRQALTAYREAWRQKMDEVNAVIAAGAEQEELVDQPRVVRNILRVSGPFTVEGVIPSEESIEVESPIGGEPEALEPFEATEQLSEPISGEDAVVNADSYLNRILALLKADGLRFPDNKTVKFSRLERYSGGTLHGEGEWEVDGMPQRVAVAVGPQYGPVTAKMVEDCMRQAYRYGFDALVFAGFTFDGAAQGVIQADPNPRMRMHIAHIRPDVTMGDLLKTTSNSQLFTVSGTPRVELREAGNGEYLVEMHGVDIYDPVENAIHATGPGKVAAWFVDADYDGKTFCITQAFFPDASAWEKLARALKDVVGAERFAAFSGTISLPFKLGKHRTVAVKVIDPRGNEVMCVLALDGRYMKDEGYGQNE